MLASVAHETGWRLPLAPTQKGGRQQSLAMPAQLLSLNALIISKALEEEDTLGIFLYIAG